MSTETEVLIVNPTDYGIEKTKANELVGNLPQITAERALLEAQYNEVVQMDIEDKSTSQKAKELRSLIRDNRTKGIIPWHKTTKEVFLRAGQFIDALKNKEIAVNERMEETLEQIEKHQAIKEAKEKEERVNARLKELYGFSENDQQTDKMIVENMTDEQFQGYLKTVKLQYRTKIEEQERLEKEKAEEALIHLIGFRREKELAPYQNFTANIVDLNSFELGKLSDVEYAGILEKLKAAKTDYDAKQEEIRLENERLKKAAQEREELTKKRALELRPYVIFIRDYQGLIDSPEEAYQKEFADVKIAAEAQWKRDHEILKQQEAEKQRLAKLEADQAAQKAKEEAEKKAATKALKAPDKEKLLALSTQIKNLALPELKSQEAKDILESVKELLTKTSDYINKKSETL